MRPAFVETLAAWCVVPYDDRPRTPAERADVLAGLGFEGLAWDWRDEHVEIFGDQIDALASRSLELTAIWAPVPDGVVSESLAAQIEFAGSRRRTPQLWACAEFGAAGEVPGAGDGAAEGFREQVVAVADRVEPLAVLGMSHGMPLALYNHLGWAGEPLNEIAVLDELANRGFTNTGLAYMQHHGHGHIDNFAQLWDRVKDRVIALGLNGTRDGAHWGNGKVLPYGSGPRDVELARIIEHSGWRGPVALICHTMDDIEARLSDDLEGLDWVARALAASPDSPVPARPTPRIPEPVWPH